ncbi:hypothetical protein [Vibrio phage phiKT1024]|nr:hypothetical protein [Vibrio phage phiKT1024]
MSNKSKYVQYVYHFDYPMNSIDVRCITKEQLKLIKDIYHTVKYPGDSMANEVFQNITIFNQTQAERILNEHFPEELI